MSFRRMTTVISAIDRARVQKYAAGGTLKLSSGFFLRVFQTGGAADETAILQIHNLKFEQGKENGARARARMTDGAFTYSVLYFEGPLVDQLKADGIQAHAGTEEEFPILAIKKYSLSRDFSIQGKTPITILDYEYLTKSPKITGASSLSENVADFAGFKPTPVTVPISFTDGDTNAPPARRPANAPPPPVRTGSGMGVTPISAITPYVSKWRILGTCTSKEDLKTVNSNQKGPLKVFNFELTDEKGDCIRITSFAEHAERISTQVQLRCSYYLSNCSVRQANKRFNATGHDYELTIRSADDLQPCLDAPVRAPSFTLKAVPLNNVMQHVGTLVDVLAVVDKVNPVVEFTARSGNEVVKRDVQIIDKSCTVVTLVMWSQQAKDFDDDAAGHVIGIKGAAVKEFNGAFTISAGTRVEMDPEINGVTDLLEWYQNERDTVQTTTISTTGTAGGSLERDLRFLGTATSLEIGKDDDKGVYMTLKGMFNGIKSETALYQACSTEGCQKKVILEHNQYRCEKCQKTSDTFKYCYMIQAEVFDMSGVVWVTMFGKAAEQLMGMNAQQLGAIKESDSSAYDELFQAVKFKPFMLRVRAKSETYNEEMRIRYSVFDVSPVPYDSIIPIMENTLRMLKEC